MTVPDRTNRSEIRKQSADRMAVCPAVVNTRPHPSGSVSAIERHVRLSYDRIAETTGLGFDRARIVNAAG